MSLSFLFGAIIGSGLVALDSGGPEVKLGFGSPEGVGKRLADGNADKAESEADAARRLGAMLAATEWQALIEGARPANAAAQSYVDATLAIAMLTSAGIGEQTIRQYRTRLRAQRQLPDPRGVAVLATRGEARAQQQR